ncbi:unnamed protein product [Sphagnum troendelagicum]|uniref:PHD-type domain-containing protein n=1 Tax=Sphagnum troendelagicum TaxID=128251 RepID=A0ABP0UIK1_9BRYO
MEIVVVPSETCCLAPKEKKAKTSCFHVQQVEETPHSGGGGGGGPNSSSAEFQYHHQTAAVAGVPATSAPDAITMPPDSAAKDIVEGADGQEARQKMEELSLVIDLSQESVISDGDNEKDVDGNKSLMMMGTKDDCIQVSDMTSSANAAVKVTETAGSSTEKTPDEKLGNKTEDSMDWESQHGSPILSNVQTAAGVGAAAAAGVVEEVHTLDGTTRVLLSSAKGNNQSPDDPQLEQEGNHRKQGMDCNGKRIHHSLNSLETVSRHKIPPGSEIGHDQPEDQEAAAPAIPVERSAFKTKTASVDSMAHCVPKNSKDLMATGYLEGQHVRYVARGRVLLTGIIQDGGVLCDCSKCKGTQMITISMFEKHAGSTAHHPSDYIILKNGNSLRKIVDNCQHAAHCQQNVLDSLKRAIGYVPTNRTSNNAAAAAAACHKCGLWNGVALLSCSQAKCKYAYHPECIGMSSVPRGGNWVCPTCEKTTKKPNPIVATKRKTAAAVAAEEQPLQTSTRPLAPPASTELHQRTTRYKELPTVVRTTREENLNVHKALFQPGGLPDGTELGYYVKGQCVRKGVKRSGGICCSCCNTVISCSAFEQHAGCDSRRSPYGSILLQDGLSLHEMALKLAGKEIMGNKAGSATTRAEKFDYCYECGDGGDLLWCHSCSDPYHLECAGVSRASESEWYCGGCLKSSLAVTKSGRRVSAKPRGGDLGAKSSVIKDGVRDPTTLFLETPDSVGGCVFCKSWEFSKSGFDARTMLLCDQCEQEYHVGCLKEHGLEDLKELPHGEWFCKQDCRAINNILALLVANGPESLFDSVISKFLESRQRQGSVDEQAEPSSPSFEWQILHGRGGNAANGRTLAEAVDIFSECFGSIKDATTGRSLIPLMVHSRSMKDHNFEGIFCVVLKRNDKVVSTALFRIFGRHLAEVPIVATSLAHQGQGHCKALMLTIERLLGVMSVERLILPAAKGKESLWIDKFGFTQMNDLQLKKLQAETQIMVFSGLSMLEKAITPMAIC